MELEQLVQVSHWTGGFCRAGAGRALGGLHECAIHMDAPAPRFEGPTSC